ncbi:MAG: N-acetylmuramoyl-L-alanine amidase [Planctomycetes bacterium]|nr:N-acetylmuramoyl-L-alanine amidase [Planctomycetota bacterium]
MDNPASFPSPAVSQTQPPAKRGEGLNLKRLATVVLSLLLAMAVGVTLCWAVMPPPHGVVRPELRQPAAVFPADMAMLRPWRFIVVHHTATEQGDVQSLDLLHRQQLGLANGIACHFLIGNGDGMADGRIASTVRWIRQADAIHRETREALPGLNGAADLATVKRYGISVALVGDFTRREPTPKQMDTLVDLVYTLSDRFGIPLTDVFLHSDLEATSCPGPKFPAGDLFRRLGEKCRSKPREGQ